MRYVIVNQDEIPPDLPPGTYITRVLGYDLEKNEIRLEFVNKRVENFSDCLIKLVKAEDDED